MNYLRMNKKDLSEINKMLVPILIEQLFLSSIGLLISFFLKKTGTQAVASIGLMNNFNMLISNVFSSIGVGVSVTVAQYVGRNDKKATGRVALQGMVMSIAFAMVVSILGFTFREQILTWILSDSEQLVYEYSRTYLSYYLLSIIFISTYTVSSAAIRGSGFPKASLIAITVYNGLYALLSGISTMVLNLGLEGVCKSQLISAVIAAIVGILLLIRGNENMHIEKFTIKPDMTVIRPMLRIGIPVLIENTCFALGRLITQTFAIPYGTDYTAANGLVNNINNIMSVPVIAGLSAAPPIVGRYIGMGDKETAKKRGTQLTVWIVLLQTCISIVTIFIINRLCLVLSDSELVRQLIKQVIYIKVIVQPIGYSLSFILPAVMRSAGDAKYVMVINTLTMFIGRIGIAYTLTHIIKTGILGIWIGQYSDWFIRLIFFIPRYKSNKWLEYSIFDKPEKKQAR